MRHTLAAAFLVACSNAAPMSAPDAASPEAQAPDAQVPDANPNAAWEQSIKGASWTKLATGPQAPGKQHDGWFFDAKTGFVASGPNNAIYKTEDGGDTWKQVFTSQGTYFRSIAFLDATHGFAGNLGAGLSGQITDATLLYETKDGGVTWKPFTNITGPMPSGVCNLSVIDATHIMAVGRVNGPSYLSTSSDGGKSFASVSLASKLMMLIDARFTSPTSGIVVGMNKKGVCSIQQTTDGSTFSEVFASSIAQSLCWKISFASDQVGFVSIQETKGGPPMIAKTTDGGSTWTELPMPGVANGAFPAVGVGFITENIGWVSPEDPSLPTYRTVDGGQTWTVDASLASPINRFRFVDHHTAFAIGSAVYKMQIP